MKLKLDEAGHVVVQDGKPVYVHDDGKDVAFDAVATVAKISQLNAEARGHREAKEAAEGKLKLFEGIEDAEAARKALETVKNIDEGKLIAAGKVEEIKAAAQKAAQEQVAAQSKAHAEDLAKLRKDHEGLLAQYHGEKIGGAFSGSKFISEKATIPADLVQARFGQAFKVEDGRLTAYDSAGNKVFSRVKPGEIADFDEALEMLVEQYPYRDQILKGNSNGGGGTRGGPGGGGSKTLTRAAFETLSATERAAKIGDGFTVTD